MTKKVKVKKETINSETLQQVLIKKALGYKVKESTNEYALVDNEYKLIKKKVSVKYYPPDLNAIELILNKGDLNYLENLSDEELEKEKQTLIKILGLNRPDIVDDN